MRTEAVLALGSFCLYCNAPAGQRCKGLRRGAFHLERYLEYRLLPIPLNTS